MGSLSAFIFFTFALHSIRFRIVPLEYIFLILLVPFVGKGNLFDSVWSRVEVCIFGFGVDLDLTFDNGGKTFDAGFIPVVSVALLALDASLAGFSFLPSLLQILASKDASQDLHVTLIRIGSFAA